MWFMLCFSMSANDRVSVKLRPFSAYFLNNCHAFVNVVLSTCSIFSFVDDRMKFPMSNAIFGFFVLASATVTASSNM